jgi:hypothetical protein
MQVQQACNTAINENAIVVISGRPGLGKSRCLFEYAVRKMTTALISVLCSPNITMRYFVQRLAQELRLDDSATTSRLEDRMAEKLRWSPDAVRRPGELSEGEGPGQRLLPVKSGATAGRPVWHKGAARPVHDLQTDGATGLARGDLLSAVGTVAAEATAIIQRGFGDDATDEVVAQILTITGGVHRQVDLIIPRILDLQERNRRKLAGGEVTMREIVATAGTKIMTGAL